MSKLNFELPVFNPVDCAHKVTLVRVDLNVPMEEGFIQDTTRLERILPTLEALIKIQAKVVLLSHLGRPKGKKDKNLSLQPLLPMLSRFLKQPVEFMGDIKGKEVKAAVAALQPGQVLLLENLRFYAEEGADDPKFAEELASLGDIYINDAFAVSHRAHASVHAITQFIPSYAGYLLRDEIHAISRAFVRPVKPVMAIIGGAKVSTKLALLKNLVEKVDYLVLGGGIANTFLYAQGLPVGSSLCEKEMVAAAQEILMAAENVKCTVITPKDAKVALEISPTASVHETLINKIKPEEKIFDIGQQTIDEISHALKNCQTVLWNGPLGVFEKPPFDQGTTAIAHAIAHFHRHRHFYSLAGGGETLAALKRSGTADQFSYLSTGGGALLEFLEGKQLPGITALLQQNNQNR